MYYASLFTEFLTQRDTNQLWFWKRWLYPAHRSCHIRLWDLIDSTYRNAINSGTCPSSSLSLKEYLVFVFFCIIFYSKLHIRWWQIYIIPFRVDFAFFLQLLHTLVKNHYDCCLYHYTILICFPMSTFYGWKYNLIYYQSHVNREHYIGAYNLFSYFF